MGPIPEEFVKNKNQEKLESRSQLLKKILVK